jgi:hypothetical protein
LLFGPVDLLEVIDAGFRRRDVACGDEVGYDCSKGNRGDAYQGGYQCFRSA